MLEKYLKPSKPLTPLVRRADILLTEDDKLRAYANNPHEKYAPDVYTNGNTIYKGSNRNIVILIK